MASSKAKKTKIVFLDRDGVINEFPGNGNYVTKVKDFHFIRGSMKGIRMLTEAGYKIFVVSNQAGVGKGVFTMDKLKRITRKMTKEIEVHGGKIKRVLYCTHRSDAGCACRKPGIGSIYKALHSINKSIRTAKNGYFIGDTKADIETGYRAGCSTIFVLSGRENRRYMRQWLVQPDYIAKDLLEAAKIITGNGSTSLRRKATVKKASGVKKALLKK